LHSDYVAPIGDETLNAMGRGQALHYLFEHAAHFAEMGWDSALQIVADKYSVDLPYTPKQIEKMLAIQEPPLREIIQDGKLEWPFEVMVAGAKIIGQIDAWGEVSNTTWIIDYKSTARVTQDKIKLAAQQLELYAIAVHQSGVEWKNIRLAILFPVESRVELVELRDYKTVIGSVERFVRQQDQSEEQVQP
jgi:hypothetical protein